MCCGLCSALRVMWLQAALWVMGFCDKVLVNCELELDVILL